MGIIKLASNSEPELFRLPITVDLKIDSTSDSASGYGVFITALNSTGSFSSDPIQVAYQVLPIQKTITINECESVKSASRLIFSIITIQPCNLQVIDKAHMTIKSDTNSITGCLKFSGGEHFAVFGELQRCGDFWCFDRVEDSVAKSLVDYKKRYEVVKKNKAWF